MKTMNPGKLMQGGGQDLPCRRLPKDHVERNDLILEMPETLGWLHFHSAYVPLVTQLHFRNCALSALSPQTRLIRISFSGLIFSSNSFHRERHRIQ